MSYLTSSVLTSSYLFVHLGGIFIHITTISIPIMQQLATFFILSLFIFITACQQSAPPVEYDIQKKIIADSAMVVSPHPLSSDAGEQILRAGGNAVDATIAVHFAMAVVYPRAGNIGGGGFMIFRQADGSTDALDYREKAPLAATADMYLDENGDVRDSISRYGHLAVGVPGTVAGMFAAHEKYGNLPIQDLIEPAIRLARDGYTLTKAEISRFNNFREDFQKFNQKPNAFIKNGEWVFGDRLVQPELAHTLELIRDQGAAGFYEGETANKIVAEMQRGNGIITLEDLQKYTAKWREPLIGNYKNYKVISMPPSSSGGVALLQMLGSVENFPLGEYGFQSTKAVHLMAEAERRAYADRAEYLGDSDFYAVPIDTLINEGYLRDRMVSFDSLKATPSDAIKAGNFADLKMESFETTHTSVVDTDGNSVSTTTTLNSNFGSKVVVGNGGFFLNNEMDDFSSKPGVPNQFGLVGAEANAIAPQKRMLSSMTPTIIEKDGELFMVLGAPGGSTIITAVFQTFVNVAEFGMDLQAAVNASRFHHQWLPDHIMYEKGGLSPEVRTELDSLGHNFREVNRMAVIKAIMKLPNGDLVGVGDPRNPDDDVAGF
ncbi:MAG: gamma-glutamyltransferase [Saprospiraceae bacterium]